MTVTVSQTNHLRQFTYIVTLSVIYATVMLILSTLLTDADQSQSTIMPMIAMWFAPFFLFH